MKSIRVFHRQSFALYSTHTHTLATGRLCLTQENPNRDPHAHKKIPTGTRMLIIGATNISSGAKHADLVWMSSYF